MIYDLDTVQSGYQFTHLPIHYNYSTLSLNKKKNF